ncbi:MAG: hypothetical protein JNK65_05265, partial [Deltaproteobacteria bacterium]|nr:hypothetical protein [Deltaproteobacteria bacterium]
FQNGKDLGSNSIKIEVEEGATIALEVRRKGYLSKTINIDDTQEKVRIRLDREKKGAGSSGSVTSSKAQPSVASVPTSKPAPQVKPGPTVGGDLDKPWK